MNTKDVCQNVQHFGGLVNENCCFVWLDYLKNVKDKVSVDVSKRGITHIPGELFHTCPDLEYLYLEGNELTEIIPEFFPSLRRLKWLDIRNNKLKTIPSTIVDHPSLQVLLLEGNQIDNLPVEIGSISSLRGIQLARNPLVFPPANVVNQGPQSTLDFLRRQWQQLQSPTHIQLISETHGTSPQTGRATLRKQKSGSKSVAEQRVSGPHSRRTQRQHTQSAVNLSKCISVRPLSQDKHQQRPSADNNWCTDQDTDDEVAKSVNSKRRGRNMRKRSVPRFEKVKRVDPEEVQPKQLRDVWIEKIRQLLLTQETILQQRKNAEALKHWQDETKMLQQTNPKRHSEASMNFPYDTDPEYRKMMSRKDLSLDGDHRRRDSSLHQMRHEVPINSEIAAIMSALKELQTSQSTSSISPRSEQKALAQEITKIKEIQRSLNALKLKNFGQLSSL